MISNSSTLMDI